MPADRTLEVRYHWPALASPASGLRAINPGCRIVLGHRVRCPHVHAGHPAGSLIELRPEGLGYWVPYGKPIAVRAAAPIEIASVFWPPNSIRKPLDCRIGIRVARGEVTEIAADSGTHRRAAQSDCQRLRTPIRTTVGFVVLNPPYVQQLRVTARTRTTPWRCAVP